MVINDKGIFEQETHMLTAQAIAQKRRRLQNHILSLRAKIQDSEIEIQSLKAEIKQAEENLTILNGPIVESYLAKEKDRRMEAERKAQNILKECIGDDFYAKLQERKRIVFTAKDNITYKIEDNGGVYRKVEKKWKLLCIIRPQNLPLPDFLLSLFVSIRENPTKYPLKHSREVRM